MASWNHLLSDPDSTASPVTTPSFTPTAGSLLIVFVYGSLTSTSLGTLASSVGGLTFVKAGPSAASGGNDGALHCFVAEGVSTATPQTVTFDSVGDQTTGQVIFVGEVIDAEDVGTDAIRQTAKQDNIAGPSAPEPSFSLAASADNLTLACMAEETSNPAAMTEPDGWTEQADSGFSTPTRGAEYASRDSGFSGTTITWGSSASIYCSMIVEVIAAEEPPPDPGNSALVARHGTGMGAW